MKKISLLLAICILAAFMLTSCSEKDASTEPGDYKYYLKKVTDSEKYMPDIDFVGDYSAVEATYKHSVTALFFELDTVGLFVTYDDEEEFLDCVENVKYEYSFYDEYPDEEKTDFLADVNGYDIVMVEDEYDLAVYKSALLIGINKEEMKICYLFYYDYDMDSLTDLDGYITEHFYLK